MSIAVAAVFVILAVAQLYSYEDFPDVVASLWLPGGRIYADVWAALIVTLEVAALPFLLAMQLSPAARVVSMVAGWGVVALWLGIFVWENVTTNAIVNSGVLGATIPTMPSWWLVVLSVVFAGILAYVSSGKWPVGSRASLSSVKQ